MPGWSGSGLGVTEDDWVATETAVSGTLLLGAPLGQAISHVACDAPSDGATFALSVHLGDLVQRSLACPGTEVLTEPVPTLDVNIEWRESHTWPAPDGGVRLVDDRRAAGGHGLTRRCACR